MAVDLFIVPDPHAICFFEAIPAGVSEAAIRYLVMPVLKMLFAGILYKRIHKEFSVQFSVLYVFKTPTMRVGLELYKLENEP